MSLDPALWAQLEQHGVMDAHLTLLLRVLETQPNGAWTLHYVHGQVTQVDLRLVVKAHAADAARIGDALEGASLLR